MGTVSRVMIGVFSVAFLVAGVTVVIPYASEAKADGGGKKFVDGKSDNHTLRWDMTQSTWQKR